jgi:hypothetical protein
LNPFALVRYGVNEEKLLWEVMNGTAWNYGVLLDPKDVAKSVKIVHQAVNKACPFCHDNPSLVATVMGRRIPEWKLVQNAAAPPPKSPVESTQPLVELKLIPCTSNSYSCVDLCELTFLRLLIVPDGATDIRLTEFPLLSS